MAQPVTTGAMMMCSFGIAPSTLNVLPAKRVNIEKKPAATILDSVPMLNIPPFGVCQSLANPTTASLTAAALGVLTPGPCIPVTTPWTPGSSTMMIGGTPALNSTSKCTCAYGGSISITFPGTVTENIP
ncbi:MAG: DUF4280 domain-containing protein [Ilumatobacter sp.]|nr:DUF4280 domain-containing protein [Ilumatobacter sp.]